MPIFSQTWPRRNSFTIHKKERSVQPRNSTIGEVPRTRRIGLHVYSHDDRNYYELIDKLTIGPQLYEKILCAATIQLPENKIYASAIEIQNYFHPGYLIASIHISTKSLGIIVSPNYQFKS